MAPSSAPPGRVVVLGLLLFGAGLAVAAYFGSPRIFIKPQSPEKRPVLAVVPFENLSGEPELELTAQELSSEVVRRLAEVEGSPFELERLGAAVTLGGAGLEETAAALGADFLLTGSLRRKGDRIEVDAYLFRAGAEPALWPERFEWPAQEADRIPGEVAARIASALSIARGRR